MSGRYVLQIEKESPEGVLYTERMGYPTARSALDAAEEYYLKNAPRPTPRLNYSHYAFHEEKEGGLWIVTVDIVDSEEGWSGIVGGGALTCLAIAGLLWGLSGVV